jgi:hypothetical protein
VRDGSNDRVNDATISGNTSILGDNEVYPPISAPINVRGVSSAIPGFGEAGRLSGAAVFPSALPASAARVVSGALSRDYPGQRSPRRPVPAGLERNEA